MSRSDEQVVLRGTAANVIGLVAGVLAAFGVQVLLGRSLPVGGLGVVTIAVQVAFVASAGSRLGMDMATLRAVSVESGLAPGLRSLVDRAALVALAASVVVAAAVAAVAEGVSGDPHPLQLGALAIPAVAACNVYLGATRGLKSMAPTLWLFWIGQPAAWIGLTAAGLLAGLGTGGAVAAYGVSWLLAAVAARAWWRRLAAGSEDVPAAAGRLAAAIRYGLPRAPSALLAQGLFWVDLFVLAHYRRQGAVDDYAAASRVAQVLLLFLTSAGMIFSPFAADLHARGDRERLDALFKRSTRWSVTATIPVLVVLAVCAPNVLHIFGRHFDPGSTALRILLAGQAVNVVTGSVAFVLIMAGRTGLDLLDNAVAMVLLVVLAAVLGSSHGMDGVAVASAVSISTVNLLRLAQVQRLIGIHPFERAYLRLAIPAAGCLAVALGVHAVLGSGRFELVLPVTAAASAATYLGLLPAGLPAPERRILIERTRRALGRAAHG
ncbi:MAG TPA: lipopolysaccharide biosynthesis protein [Gaiellales bacterium]|nr:lipopolysaccharide biosynthesis protein [Gaiellales bacterium]